MIFYVSKVLWFLMQPSSLLLAGLCCGVYLIRWGRIEAGLRWLMGSLMILAVIGLTSVSDLIAIPLEQRFPRPVGTTDVAGIIVLGGAEDTNAGVRELMSLNEAGERLTEANVLARRHPNAKLIWSGGSDPTFYDGVSGAERAKVLFEALGVAPERIVLEDTSRTTHENAANTRELIKPQPGQRWLLVTSGWHMPRAMGCFRRAGFDVIAWPVDYRAPVAVDFTRVFSSVPDGLRRFDTMAKEYVGLVAYRIAGRTDALFPAP